MAAKKKSSGKKSSSGAKNKVGKAMHERKHGTLRSGSGKKVKSKKQAIAIGLSEARKSGAKVPAKKKSSSKKRGGSKKKSSSKKRGGAKRRSSKKSS